MRFPKYLVTGLALTLPPAFAAAPKLTINQLVSLVKVLPDQVLAGEIRDRGIADEMTRAIVERVQKAGAGPQALRALRALIVKPTLIVRCNQAGSEVYVDDALKGTAGPANPLVIRDEDAGPHAVEVRKRRYAPSQQQVVLKTGPPNEVNATLELAVGTLSVVTNAPNALMRIDGLNGTRPNLNNVELAPGDYVVHVEAPQYAGITQTVSVKAGDELHLNVPLALDQNFVRSLVMRARSTLASQDFSGAARLAAAALQAKPGDADALGVAATSFFYLRDYARFSQYAPQAIQAGVTLIIPVVHHHALMSSHRAYLKLSANTIAYDPNGQPGVVCNQAPFQLPFANVRSCDLKQDQNQQLLLNLKVADEGSNRKQSLLFADYRATEVHQPDGLLTLMAPGDARNEIASLAQLIENLRGRSQ